MLLTRAPAFGRSLSACTVIGLLLLIGQAAAAKDPLLCLECTNPEACENPKSVTCNKDRADKISKWLNSSFVSLDSKADEFECIAYCDFSDFENRTHREVSGCVYKTNDFCKDLEPPPNANKKNFKCSLCSDYDICNDNCKSTSSPNHTGGANEGVAISVTIVHLALAFVLCY